jgi:histidine triad (HIT) family protein
MKDCIFCQIVAGTTKADVVYESPGAIAFLDRFPATRGHVMVIPRAHAATLLELDDGAVGGLFQAVKEVMRKVNDALAPVAFNVGWNHGKGAGQHVFHLHVHVLPRYSEGGRGVQLLGEGAERVNLAEIGEAIRRA